ncbi:proton-conducting transporter membrane subunit [Geothrix sp. 21YS21S-2]|uniref:proton-conducting transporter transmembrane domain-containing protein n=1 Tax=Geothrix sp. 21YS21S-2 TaxID=3068893 RepID=UPI0027BAB3E2|nr:proton-conducting transporter membrane subunit [Geothrix sp. 21YS21S-2]
MNDKLLILLPLAALLGGMLLQWLLAGLLTPRGKGRLAFAAVLASLAGVLAAWPRILAGGTLDAAFGPWDGPIRLTYHVDGLSLLFALMGAGIGAAVLLYAVSYMEDERATTRFYSLVLLFIGGLVHLVYTADLFLLYLSWEVVGLCSFLLVGFWYRKEEAAYGARKVLTMTHLAGYGLLGAVILLYGRTGSTLWTDPKVQGAFTTGLFLLVLVASLAKSVQFPLHTWIPDAMAAPTPVSALLHAACYVKAGVYLIARLHSFGTWPAGWGTLLAWLGATTIVVGALLALAQKDLKRLLAYSTVSQIGYMMLGLGLGTPLAVAAGLLHCLNHGLFKGGLFLCAGAVQHATGTRDMDRLGGLGRQMPRTMALWLVVAGSIAGVPLLNGFVSKWLLYDAALEAGRPMLALVPWIGSILTVFMFLKATTGVFLGSGTRETEHAHEASGGMLAGIGALAAGCVILGVAPQLAIRFLINPLMPALGYAPLAGVGWFGLTAGQGSWYASAGLGLGLVAMAFGLLVYGLARPARGVVAVGAAAVFSGGEPLGSTGRLGAGDFSRIVADALAPFFRLADVDRYYLGAWHGLNRLGARLDALSRLAEGNAPVLLAAFCAALGAFAGFLPTGPAAVPELPVPGLLAASVGLAWVGLTVATGLKRLPHFLASGALALAGLLLAHGLLRGVLLEAAAVAALLALTRKEGSRAYLAAIVLSALGTLGGALAAEHGHPRLAMALLLPGLGIKVGLVPLSLWLTRVAERAPALVTGLVIAVVDVAALAELLAQPGLFTGAPWIAFGLLSAVAGAFLALGTDNLKRFLAYSTIVDMGLITLAVALGGPLGLRGAVLGGAVHALAKALLFVAISVPEAAGVSLEGPRGLAARHPLPAAGFLVGALAVVGVPPTLGFAAHWRLFSASAGHPALLASLLAVTMLSVAVYARAIARFWWGGESTEPAPGCPAAPRFVIIVLAGLLLVLGFSGRMPWAF